MTEVCRRHGRSGTLPVAVLLATAATPVPATNGTNALALSSEAFGIGGADIAYLRDTAAVAVNPANLAFIDKARMDLGLGVTGAGSIRHTDSFGSSQRQRNTPIPFSSFGYARRLSADTVAGVAVVGQGGVGVEYKDMDTAFGNRDSLENILRIAMLSAGLAKQINPSLSLGASLELIYSDLEQAFFPDTSFNDPLNPARDFFGYRIEQADTVAAGIRLGINFQPAENMRIGMAYASARDLEFRDARYTTDLTALGLGKVRYEADITDQKQPQELGIGLAFSATDRLDLAAEINWINWSDALNRPRLTATRPDNPTAPANIVVDVIQEWDDQVVYSAGAVYTANDRLTLRAGVNYAKYPVPDRNLLPLLPLIGERHAMLGLGYDLPGNWKVDAVYVRSLPNAVTYTNANAPFGSAAEEKFSLWHLMATLTYVWDR
jgi:long-chain fatty acid transport protein